jgi:NADPH:quinone reductase-like Zn-dependent oxidoreductase
METAATLLLVGATGGVGGFVAELAAHRGFSVHLAGRDTTEADLADLNVDALVNASPADPTRFIAASRDGGAAVSVSTPAEAERGIRSRRVGVTVDRKGLETVARLAEQGVLTTRVAATFPAERAIEAYRADPSGGRIVLTF